MEIEFWITMFSKPVAFYAYTSMVTSVVCMIDASKWLIFGKDNLSEEDHDVIDYINDCFARASKLNLHNDYCSTHLDNKTVIEMSDGSHSIFLGKYDHKYYIGFGVYSEHNKCRIELPLKW